MAGSNNFVIHNPTNANQEPPATFATDSITTGGIGVDEIMPSPWMNARWYEDSVGFWALAQMMANKGFVMDKTNPAALVAALANITTTADGRLPMVVVNYSPTPTFPASTSNGFDLTLAGNVTSSAFDVAPNIGQILTFVIAQGAVPYTFVPPPSINGWKPISSIPNSINVQQFVVRANGTIWPIPDVPALTGAMLVSNGSVYIPRTRVVQNMAKGFNVAYQNNTPGSIMVTIIAGAGSGGGQMQGNVGPNSPSIEVAYQSRVPAADSDPYQPVCMTFEVPQGWFYEVNNGGGMGLNYWTETFWQ